VPLVVWGPGFSGGQVVDGLVDARDVAATVFALAEVVAPAGSGGRDLRAVARGEDPLDAVFFEGVMDMVAVRTATHRLIFRGPSLAEPDYPDRLAKADLSSDAFVLYDHRTDPGEQVDVHLEQAAVTAELRDRLVAWRRSLAVGAYTLPQEQVSAEAAAAMREHGYWDAGAPAAPGGPSPAESAPAVTPPSGPMDDPDRFCGERKAFIPADRRSTP
jgi:arylsulfatase A-like enzyme